MAEHSFKSDPILILFKGLGLMAQEGQTTSLDDIAHDDQMLKDKAAQLVGFQGLQ